jgi:hypothetical protein
MAFGVKKRKVPQNVFNPDPVVAIRPARNHLARSSHLMKEFQFEEVMNMRETPRRINR